jgi:c-di-GMP-binding flagellar brake protein YcgR
VGSCEIFWGPALASRAFAIPMGPSVCYKVPMSDRRKYARAASIFGVNVKLYDVAGRPDMSGRELPGRTSDLSEGGVRLLLEGDLPAGTEVSLRISLKEPPCAFTHTGIVRWCRKDDAVEVYHVGLEFVSASPDHQAAWRAQMAKLIDPPAGADGLQPMVEG